MKIKRSSLIFHNVLSVQVVCKTNEWVSHARELRNSIIKNGFYATGPVIYTISREPKSMILCESLTQRTYVSRVSLEDVDKEENTAEIGIYIPINAEIDLESNDKYVFIKELKFEDGLTLRHADVDDDIETVTYDTLRAAAGNYNLRLKEPFYNIYLDVFGDGVIDVYAPIDGGK